MRGIYKNWRLFRMDKYDNVLKSLFWYELISSMIRGLRYNPNTLTDCNWFRLPNRIFFSIFAKMTSSSSKFFTADSFADSDLPSNLELSLTLPTACNTLGKFDLSTWIKLGISKNKLSAFLTLMFSSLALFLVIFDSDAKYLYFRSS